MKNPPLSVSMAEFNETMNKAASTGADSDVKSLYRDYLGYLSFAAFVMLTAPVAFIYLCYKIIA